MKNLLAKQETQFRSLGGEDPLKKEMAIHCSILAWEILFTEKPGSLQSLGSQTVGHDLVIKSSNIVTRIFLPAQEKETWVQSQGQKDPLEKEMAMHSNTLAWKIPCIEEPGRLQSMGLQRARHD